MIKATLTFTQVLKAWLPKSCKPLHALSNASFFSVAIFFPSLTTTSASELSTSKHWNAGSCVCSPFPSSSQGHSKLLPRPMLRRWERAKSSERESLRDGSLIPGIQRVNQSHADRQTCTYVHKRIISHPFSHRYPTATLPMWSPAPSRPIDAKSAALSWML